MYLFYLVACEADQNVLGMFTSRIAQTAQIVIFTAFQTFINKACNWLLLAIGAEQIGVNLAMDWPGWRHHLNENSNAGTLLIVQMPFSDDPQSGQGFLDVIARYGDPIVVLI